MKIENLVHRINKNGGVKLKLTVEQLGTLKKMIEGKDLLVGAPKYLAMDDDGELRSYVGDEPIKQENGFWGDDWNSVPYDTYSEEVAKTLSFIQINHPFPYDINKMIRTGLVKTTENHPVLKRIEKFEIIKYTGSKIELATLLQDHFPFDFVVIVGEEKDFFPETCELNSVFLKLDFNNGFEYTLGRFKTPFYILDVTTFSGDRVSFDEAVWKLNQTGVSVILIEKETDHEV